MQYVCLIVLILLSACGKAQVSTDGGAIVDSELAPYFDRFDSDIGANTSGINAYMAPQTYPTIAQCILYSNGRRDIQVDPTIWNNADDSAREQILFHELGHCALFLDHISTLNSSNCPVSVMYPYAFGDSSCYLNNRQVYYDELKSHR